MHEQPRYTATDDEVWTKLFARQSELVARHGCAEYLRGFARFPLPSDRVASLQTLNDAVRNFSRWRFVPAPGFLDPRTFFLSIGRYDLPVTVHMRKPHEIEFSELPDVFHDLFGHAPILFDPVVSELYDDFAAMARRHIDDPLFLARLAKLFWVAFEVGLIRERGQVKIYGGAIMSSSGEIANIFGANASAPLLPLDLTSVASYAYENLLLQKEYYVIDSFDTLRSLLFQLEREHHDAGEQAYMAG